MPRVNNPKLRCKRQLRSALKLLDPNTRLPDVLLDTRLGKVIQEGEKIRRCEHAWAPCKRPSWASRGWTYPEDRQSSSKCLLKCRRSALADPRSTS